MGAIGDWQAAEGDLVGRYDWQAIGDEVLEVLRGDLGTYAKLGQEALRELRPIAEAVARYWRRKLQGDREAAKDFDFAKQTLALLLAHHALEIHGEAVKTALRVLERIAEIGFRLLLRAVV